MATTKIKIGEIPIGRGEWNASVEYYKENTVTLYDMSFRAKQKVSKGVAPAVIGSDGKVALRNTDVWELMSGNPATYNTANDVEKLSHKVDNIKPIVINGNVTNAPDEEDITFDGNNLLKLKDRSAGNGMGYVILRTDKTFVEQVTQPNTIYEIRYDFDLNGGEVEIPNNCVLKFDGGRIANGSVRFSDTILLGDYYFDGLIAVYGSILNESISTQNFNFITSDREIYYMLNLVVPHIKFKYRYEYHIPIDSAVSNHNIYWMIISDDRLNYRKYDFNYATIKCEKSTFIEVRNTPIEHISIENLTFEGIQNPSSLMVGYNGISYTKINACIFKNTSFGLLVKNPNYNYNSTNVHIDAEFIGTGIDGSEGGQCFRLYAVRNFNINIKVTDSKLSRVVGLDGASNGTINAILHNVHATSGAFLIQEYNQMDGDNLVFSHCKNLTYNITVSGKINGHIFPLSNYTSVYDESVSIFAMRTHDVYISNIKININAKDVTGEPYWILCRPSGRQVGEDGKHLPVRFWWDVTANVFMTNCVANSLVSIQAPIVPIDDDDDLSFCELAMKLNINGILDTIDNPRINIYDLDATSDIKMRLRSSKIANVYMPASENHIPNMILDTCQNVRIVLESNKNYGCIKFVETTPMILNEGNINTVYEIKYEGDWYKDSPYDFTAYHRKAHKYYAVASQDMDLSIIYNKCAKNDEYIVAVTNITQKDRELILKETTDGSALTVETITIKAGQTIMMRIGKLNNYKYYYIDSRS